MKKRRSTLLLLAAVLILACTCPAIGATGANPPATATPEAASPTTAAAVEAPSPTSTVAAPTACTAQLSANSSVFVREGPGTEYDDIGSLNTGQIAAIAGKNSEGTWWHIVYPSGPGGHGWVSGSVTTATCVSGSLAVIVPPPTPVPPTVVTGVSVSVDPTEIHVAGCMGPIQLSTVTATIEVNGPIKIKYHFDTDQNGALPTHTLNFNEAGAKDVSETFLPPVAAGTYKVKLVIDGMNLGGMDFQAKYKIFC